MNQFDANLTVYPISMLNQFYLNRDASVHGEIDAVDSLIHGLFSFCEGKGHYSFWEEENRNDLFQSEDQQG